MSRTTSWRIFLLFWIGPPLMLAADSPESGLRMLVPGFTVRELPLELTSQNNLEYTADGRLFAGGYDGRFHLLRDTDGDGLEDRVETFSAETTANYPLGMAVKDGDLYAVLTDEVIRWRDTDGDGVPDKRETVVAGFDDPKLVAATFLSHRRVDSSMAIAIGPDGSLYVTMGNAGYNNPYWFDKTGNAHYSPAQRRGCLLRIAPDGKVSQFHSGLRYIMSLQFNRHGDLFGTDQEGATWVPNGNPFDEFLHLPLAGSRHFGFPPRHPRWLPDVVDEPSTFDYAPQHESTCGFRFNGPAPGRGRFGPEWWSDDAVVTGESRGRLWRTSLAKTAAGYVARSQLIGRVDLLAVDCAISPRGELVVCCHTGKPDWGNGPNGAGRIFKIQYAANADPLPVMAWPVSPTQTMVEFDRPLAEDNWREAAARLSLESGRYVSAADEREAMRPGYAVVGLQLRQPRTKPEVKEVRVREDRRGLVVETAPRGAATKTSLHFAPGKTAAEYDLDCDLSGVTASWQSAAGESVAGWLPHPDFAAALELLRGSSLLEQWRTRLRTSGTLTLQGQLDLWRLLTPATQPGSQLDYEPQPEHITVRFQSDSSLTVEATGATVERVSDTESHLTVTAVQEGVWPAFTLTLATPATKLDVSFTSPRDRIARPLPVHRFLVPFAKPAVPDDLSRVIPQIAGGNWERGREVFRGKGACTTCHQFRGEGFRVGAELSNQAHRDYNSVLRDITDPSAMINPDAVGYVVTTLNGLAVTGTRIGETPDELQLAQPGGAIVKVPRSDIESVEPMRISLMPQGIDKVLTPAEIRDLMTYLLTEKKP